MPSGKELGGAASALTTYIPSTSSLHTLPTAGKASVQAAARTLTPRMWNSNSDRCIFCTADTKVGALQMTLTSSES